MFYSGKVNYCENEIDFQFDGKLLSIYPSFELFKEITMHKGKNGGWILSTKKPFTNGVLDGKVNGEPTIIHFFFDPMGYGTTQKDFTECTILINIKTYITYNKDISFPATNVKLTYRSLHLHRFLNLIPRYNISSNLDSGLCGQVNCSTDTTKLVSAKSINSVDVKIKPSFSCKWGGAKFEFYPEILTTISSISDETDLLKIYESLKKLIQYAFMRTNIYPDTFLIQFDDGSKAEINSNLIDAESEDDKDVEDCNSIWTDFIPWAIFYKHAADIFEQVYNNFWYMDNIPQTKNERLWVSNIIISKETAAFEHEFTKSFPKGLPTHSEKRLVVEKEIEQELRPLYDASTGKKRKVYKGFIEHIRNDALADKIEYCLETYEPCIKWIKSKIGKNLSFEQIAEICSTVRNDVDHGNKKIEIDYETAKAYGIMRALIYAMQLKKTGYDDDDINLATKSLFFMKGIA